jgi:adenylate cyclase class IV
MRILYCRDDNGGCVHCDQCFDGGAGMIESELRIYNIDLPKILKVLAERGFKERETQQQENYFLQQKKDIAFDHYIRIRVKQVDKQRIVTFTTKQEINCCDGIHSRQEYEVQIEDDVVFIKAMQLIGYEIKNCIKKKRIIFSMDGFADINIDIFDDRGVYIEIEHQETEIIKKTQKIIEHEDIYYGYN